MEPQKQNAKPVGAVMIMGAGIAGLQAALDLAKAGFYVHLVEKKPAVGGVFPAASCRR